MQTKSKALRRLNTLYVIFFSVIIIALIAGICSRDFQTGFKEGSKEQRCEKISGQGYQKPDVSRIQICIPINRNANVFDVPLVCTEDSSTIIRARITEMDIQVKGKEAPHIKGGNWVSILQIISLLSYGGIFVVIFIILYSLKSSIKTGNIFNRNNIKLTRAIGILLIISSIIYDTSYYIECKIATILLSSTSWQISTDVFNFRDIITGLLILVIAEIFAIGYDITEEQKLTI